MFDWSLFVSTDVCGTLVTMYECGVEDVDGVYGRNVCLKLQDKNLHEIWWLLTLFFILNNFGKRFWLSVRSNLVVLFKCIAKL